MCIRDSPYRSKLKDEISTQQVELPSSTLQFTVEDLEPSIYYQFWVVSNSISNMGNASIIQGYRVATSRSQVNDDSIGNAISQFDQRGSYTKLLRRR